MSFTVVGSNIILSHYVSLSLSQYHSSSVFFLFHDVDSFENYWSEFL